MSLGTTGGASGPQLWCRFRLPPCSTAPHSNDQLVIKQLQQLQQYPVDHMNQMHGRRDGELCPFCGKPFKRLKSHLPHCKMSPGSKTTKNSKSPQDLLTSTPKDTPQKEKKKTVNLLEKKLNDSSYQSIATTSAKPKVKVKAEKASTEFAKIQSAKQNNPVTVKARSKWLAKREQEMAKQAILLTQKEGNCISGSQQEKQSATLQGQVKGTPQMEGKRASGQTQKLLTGTKLTSMVTTTKFTAPDLLQGTWTTGSVAEELQNSPKALRKDLALSPRVKEQAGFSFFRNKTCVWDHIKHGLHDRRSGIVPLLYTTAETQEVPVSKCQDTSVLIHKSHIANNLNSVTKETFLTSAQTSVQRPAEDLLNSRLQSKTDIKWTHEMATGCGGTSSSLCQSGISSNREGIWTKSQSLRSPPQSQGPRTEQRLGDVRLGELAAWFAARTPKSPRDAVTMLTRGWTWYYRKYIDVQKGGIGGISMLVAGYCILSYIWSYPHLKRERWRKYH